MIDSIIMSLQKMMGKYNPKKFNFYLFGSLIKSSQSNDIDLLIEYDEKVVSISDALKLRVEIYNILKKTFKLDVDICLLSISENTQTGFIVKEKGVLLPLTKNIVHLAKSAKVKDGSNK